MWLNTVKAMGTNGKSYSQSIKYGVPQIQFVVLCWQLGEKPNLQFDEPDYILNFLDVMEETDGVG